MKKKFFYYCISLFFWISSCASASEPPTAPVSEESTVFSGTAQESKAGLVVDGVMITSLNSEDIRKYAGKKVKVKGVIGKKKEIPDKYSQHYTMPSLTRLDWIQLDN